MKHKLTITKKDIVTISGCVVFALAGLGAVGSTGRRRAKEAVCLSNLHKWGAVFKMFTDDNNGRFLSGDEYGDLMDGPSGYPGEGKIDDHDHSWPLVLRSFYGDEKLLRCPEASGAPVGGERVRRESIFSTWALCVKYIDNDNGEYISGSYGVNSWLYDRPGAHNGVRYWRRIQIRGASKIPLLLDCYWCEGFPLHQDRPPVDRFRALFYDEGCYMKRFCVGRHMAGTNGLFFDLSARKVGLKELWKLEWHRRWNENDDPPPVWPEWMENLKDY